MRDGDIIADGEPVSLVCLSNFGRLGCTRQKKSAQACSLRCDELIDKGAIHHRRIVGCMRSGAGRVHTVIVGWSTRNRPLLRRPINDTP